MRGFVRYLILSHVRTEHLDLLIEAVSQCGVVYIHVDAKADFATFGLAPWADKPNVFLIDHRFDVEWGGFGMVDATLELARTAFTDATPDDYFVLMSQSDYPLVDPRQIARYLLHGSDVEFMNLKKLPFPAAEKPLSRISRIYLPFDRRDGGRHVVRRAINRVGVPKPYRSKLGNLQPYCGSQWWALSANAIRYLIDQCQPGPLQQLYRRSYIPDEGYLQTVIGNSEFREHARPNLTYTDWTGQVKPAEISRDDISRWIAIGSLEFADAYGARTIAFARKFPANSAELVNLIQDQLWPQSEALLPTGR